VTTALVTGASRGIGRAIAAMLAARGALVVAAARGENAGETVAAITAAGHRAERATVDVTDQVSIDALVAGTLAAHGRIDILVNNAGITRDQLLVRMKDDDWDQVLDTNLRGVFLMTRAAGKVMMRQRSGRIISIASTAGAMGNPGRVNYSAAKAGIIGFTKSLARELATKNINVNALAPLAATPMTETIRTNEKFAASMMNRIPMKRWAEPSEIAGAFVFMASNAASYITGQVLPVDGGMVI